MSMAVIFFAEGRSEWNPDDLTERPHDMQGALDTFERANTRLNR